MLVEGGDIFQASVEQGRACQYVLQSGVRSNIRNQSCGGGAEVFHSFQGKCALFQMVYANQVTNSLKLFGITFQVFFFVREGPADRFDELRIPHCIIVCFSFIVDCIESLIVQTFQL